MEPVRFLLVDDLDENLLALEGLLRREGLELLKARSGEEALELLLDYDVALALIDVQMPGMDGFELAELIRGFSRSRTVPIIFLTAGSADRQRRFRGYETGAVDFLQKPLEPHILKSKAEVFFELYRQRQEVARQRDELKLTTEENSRLLQESRQYARALQEADRRKDEFLATLAHELRNPLAPLRNGLQLLAADEQAQSEPLQQLREMMDRQLRHLVRLIDDLLDMSRISRGKIDLRCETITVQEVVRFALEASRHQLDAARHELSVSVPPEPIHVHADLNRLTQVISNLLNNAAKYTPPGGRVRLEVSTGEGRAVLRVEDNGLGIPSDKLGEIFELFSQVSGSGRAQEGLGIGLALARQLVEMHGGEIHVDSAGLGRGSSFRVELPIVAASQPRTVRQAPQQPSAEGGLSVLVVDDNEASAETSCLLLEIHGHQAVMAHDGHAALEVARNHRPDAILLDIGLPGLDGYQVCRELRRDPDFQSTLIIAQTGLGQQRDRERANDAGFDHYLVKPVDMKQVVALLTESALK